MLSIALPLAAAMLLLALALATWRLLRGPALADRILALDTLYVITLALLVLLGLWQGHRLAFELALLIALLGFIGTVALAAFITRGRIIE